MTGPSDIIRDGADPQTSRHEAAGDSATSGVNAVHRRFPWRTTLFALAAAGVIGAAGWVLFGSRLLVVRSVIVTGTHLVPRAEVLAAADIEPGTPLIRLNTAQVAARIDSDQAGAQRAGPQVLAGPCGHRGARADSRPGPDGA